jgi:S23 ribosomal protein.
MSKYLRFEELDVWKDAMCLSKNVYAVLKDCKDYDLKSQMQRAAISVPSNIAEGYECKGTKETEHFLYIAKGSCGELCTQLYLATDLGYIEQLVGHRLIAETVELSIKTYRYAQSLSK